MNDATPWVDPELPALGKLLQEKGLTVPDRTVVPLTEVRAAQDRIGAFLGDGSVALKDERHLSLPGPGGQVPCRLYMPDDAERPPLMVYAHGGAFVQGSLTSWDHFVRDIVRQSGVAVPSSFRDGTHTSRSIQRPRATRWPALASRGSRCTAGAAHARLGGRPWRRPA